MIGKSATDSSSSGQWKHVGQIPGFPFGSFAELQTAVAKRRAGIGVDSLAAAEWANESSAGIRRAAVTALSLLVIIAGVGSVLAAFWLRDYWLLAAVPVQGAMFYFADPASRFRKWVTIAGVGSLILFIDFVFNRWVTAAVLVAYAGLTFAAVRAAGFIATSDFRKALISNEAFFMGAYRVNACSVRDNDTKRVHQTGPSLPWQ